MSQLLVRQLERNSSEYELEAIPQYWQPTKRNIAAERFLIMKSMVIGMLLSMSAAAGVVSLDDTTAVKVFCYSLIGGTLGMLAGLAYYGEKTVQGLARQGVCNLCMSVAFGKIASSWVSLQLGVECDVFMLVAVSAVLGMSGQAMLLTIYPVLKTSMPILVRSLMPSSATDKDQK